MKNFLPATALIVPNDIISKKLFTLSADEYQWLLGDAATRYTVKEGTHKSADVVSTFNLFAVISDAPSIKFKMETPPSIDFWAKVRRRSVDDTDGYNAFLDEFHQSERERISKLESTYRKDNALPTTEMVCTENFKPSKEEMLKPLSQADRMILSACIAEFDVGNKCITPSILYRDVFGKSSGINHQKPTDNQISTVMRSVVKLANTFVKTDLTDVCNAFQYAGAPATLSQKFAPILPCRLREDKFQGQDVTAIEFTAESPLMSVCNAKVKVRGKNKGNAQIIRLDRALLNTGRNNSADISIFKFYVACRVLESLNHKLNHSLTYDNIFRNCRLDNLTRHREFSIRNALKVLMKNFKEAGLISDYEFTQKEGKEYSINFCEL